MQLSAFPCETIYDLAYIVFKKRCALILVGLFLMFSCSGLILTYFILFGEISAAFMKELVSTENEDKFYCHRTIYIFALCGLMGPLFYSKTLKELTIVAVVLCTVFGVMIGTFVYQLCVLGTSTNPDFQSINGSVSEERGIYWDFEMNWNIIGCISISLNGLNSVSNYFPLYENVKGSTKTKSNKVT